MLEECFHHFLLDIGHDSVQIIYDLFFCGLQIVCNDLFFIKDVIFFRIDLFAGQQMFKDVPCTFSIDVFDRSGYFYVGSF